MLDKVKHVILILSGKGGVGKSTISTQLSLALKESGYKVGLLDIDLCGPSIPHLLGLEGRDIYQWENGWLPIYTDDNKDNGLAVMSIGFLLKNKNEAVIWRGPKKTAMIRQFLNDVEWGELDYLIIDTPPGTSDEHITIMECMQSVKSDGAIIVTTPQQAALDDVRKEITFCKKTKIPILGIIENMSGFVCPHCSNCTNIFSSNGGKALSEMAKLNFLGTLPIDPRIGILKGTSSSAIKELPDTSTAKVLKEIVEKLVSTLT